MAGRRHRPNITRIAGSLRSRSSAELEKTMTTTITQNLQNSNSEAVPAATRSGGLVQKAVRGAVVAGTIAALSLTAIPTTAHAGGPGVGAAIGLGILGGALAGAAIASTTAPVYAAPPAYYYPNGYYYNPAPVYYSQPYYNNYSGYSPYYGYYYR
jgi:hypothetical protein